MLSFGNKDFRNLQEQVLKNMKDIQDMEEGATVLAEFGIKIVGQVNSAAELPNPATYGGDFGDAYIVGEDDPYRYYIYTRAFEGQENPSWFDLGQFPVPGPTGPQGPQGEPGVIANVGMTIGSVSTLNPGQNATANIVKSGTLTNPNFALSLGIPQGAQGIQGPQGPQGPQGAQGPKGDKGDKGEQGGLIEIVGIVATADLLPSPATLQKLDAAYLVGVSPDYELYVQVGETPSTALWTNLGKVNEGTVVTVGGIGQPVWNADTKVSVFDGQLVNTLYGEAAGTGQGQTHVPYGDSASANYIVQRDINAQVNVPLTPTSNAHAASKKYVDDTAASVLPTEQAGDLIVGTSTEHVGNRLAIGSANQVLSVNDSGDGLEYKTINSVPSYTSSDADKALKVNSLGTGIEWGVVSGGGGGDLPLKRINTTTSMVDNIQTINNVPVESATSFIGTSSLFLNASGASNLQLRTNAQFHANVFLLSYNGTAVSMADTRGASYSLILDSSPKCTAMNGSIFQSSNIVSSHVGFGNITASLMLSQGGIRVNSTRLGVGSSILCGDMTITNSNSSNNLVGSLIVGTHQINLNYTSNRNIRIAVLGNKAVYNDNTDNGNKLIVGADESSSYSNCFVAGNNATDGDYIMVGDTKLTETQLQALLAKL